jgi:hypothetical protein
MKTKVMLVVCALLFAVSCRERTNIFDIENEHFTTPPCSDALVAGSTTTRMDTVSVFAYELNSLKDSNDLSLYILNFTRIYHCAWSTKRCMKPRQWFFMRISSVHMRLNGIHSNILWGNSSGSRNIQSSGERRDSNSK